MHAATGGSSCLRCAGGYLVPLVLSPELAALEDPDSPVADHTQGQQAPSMVVRSLESSPPGQEPAQLPGSASAEQPDQPSRRQHPDAAPVEQAAEAPPGAGDQAAIHGGQGGSKAQSSKATPVPEPAASDSSGDVPRLSLGTGDGRDVGANPLRLSESLMGGDEGLCSAWHEPG
jgi:hypothetical protein